MKRSLITLSMLVATMLAKSQTPNVIWIMADDLGYHDLSCYGATKIKTPAIDQLAEKGVQFTNAYAPAATSSPSRYALLTGKYAFRKGVGILPADAPLSIATNEITLAKLFQSQAYVTALVGKWHLGLGDKAQKVNFNEPIQKGPLAVGFDYAFYIPATNDRVPCVYMEGDKVWKLDPKDPIEVSYQQMVGTDATGKQSPEKLKYQGYHGHDGTIVDSIARMGWMTGGKNARWKDDQMTEVLLNKGLQFIENNANKPFFLYFASQLAHEPRVPSARFRGKSNAGLYGDVIEEFDFCVASIVEKLKALGIYENTIIVITSDNGPMIKEGYTDGAFENRNGHDPFGNLHGEKYSLYEGGTKVPFIYSWPKQNLAFVQEQAFGYVDALATFAIFFQVAIPSTSDSRNAIQLFQNPQAPPYRDYILTQNNDGQVAIRRSGWKYIKKKGGAELYDLQLDPSELHNLILGFPQKAKELDAYLQKL